MTIIKQLVLTGIGGIVYIMIELIARGYSHWTMFAVGGICFFLLGLINELIPWRWSITTQALLGAVIITVCELIAGLLLNVWLGLNVWDYTGKAYNFMGQICAENCLYWLLLSPIGIVLDDWIRYVFFGEEKPHYRL